MRHNLLMRLLVIAGLILGGVGPTAAPAAPKDRWPADHFFRIDAKPYQMKNGQLGVWGYVNSLSYQNARVGLEVEGLDAQGNVLGYQAVKVDEVVPVRGRAYFDTPVRIPGAVTARAFILWYDWVGETRGDFMRFNN